MDDFYRWLDNDRFGDGLTLRRILSEDQQRLARIVWRAARGLTEKETRDIDSADHEHQRLGTR